MPRAPEYVTSACELPVRTVVIQPTTICNLDCTYCYLPDRRVGRFMSPKTAAALASSISESYDVAAIEVLWHGGEPLSCGYSRFVALLDEFSGSGTLSALDSDQWNSTNIALGDTLRIHRIRYWYKHRRTDVGKPSSPNSPRSRLHRSRYLWCSSFVGCGFEVQRDRSG